MNEFLKWEVYFAEYLGVKIYFHMTTFIFLLMLVLFGQVMYFTIMFMALIAIMPHEYGHILAARQYGVKCKKILMTPLGGLALLSHMPREWKKELWIASAGPLVSLGLCVVSFPIGMIGLSFGFNWIFLFSLVNGFLFLFNLLPLYPSDGGRILRAILSSKIDHRTATWYTVRIGQVLSITLLVIFLLSGSFMGVLTMIALILMAEMDLKYYK